VKEIKPEEKEGGENDEAPQDLKIEAEVEKVVTDVAENP